MPARFDGAEGRGWRLYHGDCLPILHALPDACLDAVITDPPYSSGGWTAASRRRDPSKKYHASDAQPTFAGDQRDQRGYSAWCREWMGECYRALRPDRGFLCFTDWRQLPTMSDSVQAAGFVWRGVVVWDKTEACRPQPNGFRNQTEFIVYATKGGIPSIEPRVYLPGVIRCPAPRERVHMTEKPLGLLTELMRIVPMNGVICDPFVGSGTTGEAALRVQASFIGSEWSRDYWQEARERIARTASCSGQSVVEMRGKPADHD